MIRNNFILKLILFSILFKSNFSISVLRHGGELKYGTFKSWEHCPQDSLVNGFEVKADTEGKTFNDEEGMTGIRLFCADENGNDTAVLSSSTLDSGHWRGMNICPPNEWLTGFRIRIERYRGVFKDDSAVNDFDMTCSSNTTFQGKGNSAGDWSEWIYCPKDEFICGLRTKVEDSFTADKVGLVAVTMRCCHVGETVAWDYDYDYHSDNNSTDSNTYEDTFNQIGTNIKNFGSTVKNFASESASEVENAFDDAKNAFNDAKKDIEDRFKNENSTLPSTEDTNKTAEEIKFPPH